MGKYGNYSGSEIIFFIRMPTDNLRRVFGQRVANWGRQEFLPIFNKQFLFVIMVTMTGLPGKAQGYLIEFQQFK